MIILSAKVLILKGPAGPSPQGYFMPDSQFLQAQTNPPQGTAEPPKQGVAPLGTAFKKRKNDRETVRIRK